MDIKQINNMQEKQNKIPINIWDDFYDENGETYAFVDDYTISDELCEKYLTSVIEQMRLLDNDFDYCLIYHNSENDYDTETIERCKKQYGKDFFYKQWEIRINNFNHIKLNKLLKDLNNSTFEYDFNFYSES